MARALIRAGARMRPSRALEHESLELVRHQTHQTIFDLVPAKIADGREVELVADGLAQELRRVADLGQIDARVLGERAQRTELAARGREALQRAIEVEQIDHELEVRGDAGAARGLGE